jgi:hypothetical protein
MATRAASAAPIQRVLPESGIRNPLSRANRSLNTLETTMNASYSLNRHAGTIWESIREGGIVAYNVGEAPALWSDAPEPYVPSRGYMRGQRVNRLEEDGYDRLLQAITAEDAARAA